MNLKTIRLKSKYKAVLLILALGGLVYFSMIGGRIIEYSAIDGFRGALRHAVSSEDVATVRLLLLAGFEPDEPYGDPIITAAILGNLEITRLLLRAGAFPNPHDSIRETPMGYACIHGDQAMMDLLMEYGAPYDLYAAMILGDWEFVDAEVEAGHQKLSEIRFAGMPWLTWAAERRSMEEVRRILDFGMNPGEDYEDQISSLGSAKANGQTEIVALYEAYMVENGLETVEGLKDSRYY